MLSGVNKWVRRGCISTMEKGGFTFFCLSLIIKKAIAVLDAWWMTQVHGMKTVAE